MSVNLFNFLVKDVPTKFVVLSEQEFEVNNVISVLDMFATGDGINNYELNEDVANILVYQHVLEKYSDRNTTLYRKTKNFDRFYEQFWLECFRKEE